MDFTQLPTIQSEIEEFSKGNSDYNSFYSSGKSVIPNANVLGLVIHDRFSDSSIGGRDPAVELEDLKIPFQYIEKIPDWKKTANYEEIGDIMGRYEGLQVYKNSSSQSVALEIRYNAESIRQDADTYWTLENIEILIRKLKALSYPSYDGRFSPPPICELNIGAIYNRFPVKVLDVSVSEEPPYIGAFRGVNKKVTLELKSSYPIWQVVGARQVNIYEKNNEVFAIQDFNYD